MRVEIPGEQMCGESSQLRQLIWRVVLPYAAFGVLWILCSDLLVSAVLQDPLAIERASIFKGWAYVLATSALLLWLLQRELHRRQLLETTQRVSQTLIDHLPQRIFFKDKASRYVSCNEAFAADVKQTPGEMAGRTDFDFYPQELAEKYRSDDQRVLASGQTLEVDERHVLNGEERWVHTLKTPIRDVEGRVLGVLGIFWDITAQRAASEALRESEESYRRLVEESPEAIAIHRDGMILYVNAAGLRLCGATAREQVVGHAIYELIHPDQHAQIRERVAALLEGRPVPVLEERLLRVDGREVVMEAETTVVTFRGAPAIQSLLRDITERKRAATRLERLNACFASLGTDPAANINHLVAACGEVLGADCALYNRLADGLLCAAGQWQSPPNFKATDQADGHICHDVIRRGGEEVLLVRDLPQTPYAQSDAHVRNYALRTYMGKAVFFGGQAIGSLCVVFQKDFEPTEDDRKMLRIIAASIGMEEERRHAEQALRESEERYRRMVETLPDAILVHRDGRFLYANPAALRLAGATSSEQLLGTAVMERIHPDFRERVRQRVLAVQQGSSSPLLEEKFLRLDGSAVDVEASGTPVVFQGQHAIQVLIRDITLRKQAEEQLRRLATVVEQSAEAVVMTDTLGAIQYVNPAFERLSGYTRTEVLGCNPRCLKSGKQDAEFYRAMWAALTAGQSWRGHFTNRRKDGSLYDVEAVVSPIHDDAGKPRYFVSSARDVTREVQLESQFRQAQKMETIGQLAGGVAHDFNNLLQAILGFCELLLGNTPEGDARREDVLQIQRAAERAANLTRQLLAFSRKQLIEPRVLNLNATIADMEKMLRRVIGEGILLVTMPEPALHRIKADPGQIEQVLMNLAVNARDAMPHGGRVTIRTENVVFGEAEAVGLAEVRSGDFVCLSFTDTGHGMTPEVQEHLFEPFFSTKGLGKGTGLGLAVIYGIVKQNNGWINVYSQVGQGTTFKLFLPAFQGGESATAPDAIKLNQPAPRGRGERILLVEDEPEVRNLAAHLLRSFNYDITVAESGKAARAALAQAPQPFAALFSDIVLPDLNGIALADECRVRQPGLPVLLCSGYSDALTRWADISDKGYHFLQKPYPAAALLTLLRHVLDVHGQPPPQA